MRIGLYVLITLFSMISNNDDYVINNNKNNIEKISLKEEINYKYDSEEEYIVINGIGEKKNSVGQYSLNLLNTELNKLPRNVTDKFVKSGWHIYVTDENLSEKYFANKYNKVQGLTNYDKKTILIANNQRYIKESTIHEVGHFIDYYYGYISYEDDWIKIYNEEKDSFKKNITNSSCVRNSREFFAETVYYIYIDPSKCTPKAKKYINKLIKNM